MSININRILMCFAAVAASLAAHAEGYFYMENFTVKSGSTYELPICVNTGDLALYGVQCDLILPEGVTTSLTNGAVDLLPTERCVKGHTLFAKYVPELENTIRILLNHETNLPFEGTNGPVVKVPLEVNLEPGVYNIQLNGCRIVVKPEDLYIEEKCPGYTITMTVLPARRWTLNQLYAEDMSVGEGSNVEMELGYYSASDVSKYSTDVTLPEGVTVSGVTFQPVVADVPKFTNSWSFEENTLKISGKFGGTWRDVPAEGGELIFAKVMLDTSSLAAGEYDITLGNQFLSNVDGDYDPEDYTAKLTVVGPIRLGDGEEYANTADIEHADIIYTRNFPKATWQALYLPYALEYDEWADKGIMAQLNNVHMYDTDGDRILDKTTLEFDRVTKGSIAPNVPYVFKPFVAGKTEFTSRDRTLKAAPLTDGYVDCASTTHVYTIYGNYVTKEGLYQLGAYALNSDGVFTKAETEDQTLKPFRIYLLVTDRDAYNAASRMPMSISVTVDGETTGIDDLIVIPEGPDAIYDLHGNPISNPSEGIYIINGKKTYLK